MNWLSEELVYDTYSLDLMEERLHNAAISGERSRDASDGRAANFGRLTGRVATIDREANAPPRP